MLCRDTVFHTTPTPTVCYSVSSIVEVSGGCQSVNMSAPTRDCYSGMICILRKIHRLRKHPWISAQTMDPQIAQADPWISQIHRLRPTLSSIGTIYVIYDIIIERSGFSSVCLNRNNLFEWSVTLHL